MKRSGRWTSSSYSRTPYIPTYWRSIGHCWPDWEFSKENWMRWKRDQRGGACCDTTSDCRGRKCAINQSETRGWSSGNTCSIPSSWKVEDTEKVQLSFSSITGGPSLSSCLNMVTPFVRNFCVPAFKNQKQTPRTLTQSVILLQDNARPHTASVTKFRWEILDNP